MPRIVEVYISSKEIVTQTSIEGRPLAAGGTVHYCTIKGLLATKTEKILSKEDETTLQLIQKIAIEKNLKVQIIDVAKFTGKIKAFLKRVKNTPTIIFEKNRIVGTPKTEELKIMLTHE
ncbi:MAG: hypothetical protein QXM22_01420 [Candidatus Bathyarchaeia archaeon]